MSMLTKRKAQMSSNQDSHQPEIKIESSDVPKKATTSKMENYENVSNVETPLFDMDNENKQVASRKNGLAVVDHASVIRIYIVTQSIGAVLLLLLFFWIILHLGGFGFDNPSIVFNFHPWFMIIGFIVIYGNALLIYRVQRYESKPKLKRHHALRNGIQITISAMGSMSAFYFHQKAGIPHFYSLHSWLGLLTWLAFTSQFGVGLYVYLYPMAKYSTRQLLMPYHRFLGAAIFVLATATCLTGLNEKAIFSLPSNPKYSDLPLAGVMINLIALVLVVYSSLTIYLVSKAEYARSALPEEEVININLNQ